MKQLIGVFLTTMAIVMVPDAAFAAPVLTAVAATIAGGAAAGVLAGGGIIWASVLGQAAVAGVLAGAQSLLAPSNRVDGALGTPDAQSITLNRIQPVTNGLIVYGERTVGGPIVARSTTPFDGVEHTVYNSVIPLACHEIDGAERVWLGETLVWTGAQYLADATAGTLPPYQWGQIDSDYKGKFNLKIYNGSANQVADPVYELAASEWSTAMRGQGIAYVYFQAPYDRDIFPSGVPQIRVRIRGKRVFDPRTGLTAWTDNPALHLRDYVLTPEDFGGVGWTTDDIDETSIIALANASDEDVQGEPRFAFNGVLDTGDSPEQNMNRLSTSWSGWWTVDRGKLRVGGGVYEPPVFTITEDMMRGPLIVTAKRDGENQFNIVKAVYADPTSEFTATDLPVISSSIYKAQDGGEDRVRDLGELPGETSFNRAQGLMRLALLKGRRQRSVEVTCSLEAWDVSLGDNVMLTVARRGWNQEVFEVVGRRVSIAPDDVSITFSLIENGPAVYNRDTSLELPKPTGLVPTLPSPTTKPVVGPPTVSEELYDTRGGGGIKVRVTLRTQSDNPFTEAYQFRYQRIDQPSEMIILPFTRDPEYTIPDVAPGLYVFGVRAGTKRGIWSDYYDMPVAEVYGLNAVPQIINGLQGAVVSGILTLRWNAHPDLDVRQGGTIEVRHSSRTDATWQTSSSIGVVVPGSATSVTVPAIPGRYLLRPVDSVGVLGPVSSFDTTAPGFENLTVAATVTEDPGFAGGKTDCTLVSGALEMDEGVTFAQYDFAGQMDFGALKTVRLTKRLAVRVTDRFDLFDSPELFDSIALFEGESDAIGDVKVFYSASEVTPDDFGPWIEFDRAEIQARKLRFKAELTTSGTNFKTEILELGAVAEEQV